MVAQAMPLARPVRRLSDPEMKCSDCGVGLTAATKHRDTWRASGRMYCRGCMDALNAKRKVVRAGGYTRQPCVDGTQAHFFDLPWPHGAAVPCARGCGEVCEPPRVIWEVLD